MTPPIRRKGPGSTGATEGANPAAQEAKPQGITEKQLSGVLDALKKPPPRMSGAGASTASRPVRTAAPVENPFAKMNLTVPLPKPVALSKRDFDFNRIIGSILKSGFPKEILDAMNKVKPLSVAMALPNFDFSTWVKETTAVLDAKGGINLAPNGRKYTEVIRLYTDVLKEYDHTLSFENASNVKLLRQMGLAAHLYKILTESPVDTRNNSVEELTNAAALSIGLERTKKYLADLAKTNPKLSEKINLIGNHCLADPQVGKFLYGLLCQGEHRQFLSFLITKNPNQQHRFMNDVQVADILFSPKIQPEDKGDKIDDVKIYNIPDNAKDIINSLTEDEVKEAILTFHKTEINNHLDLEANLQDEKIIGEHMPLHVRAELGVITEKMTLSSHAEASETRKKLPLPVEQACQLILAKGIEGAQDLSRVARAVKDVRKFRTTCCEAQKLALIRVNDLKSNATDNAQKQRYEKIEKSLENSIHLFSDNDYFDPREMDILAITILAIEHPVGSFFASESSTPEDLEKIILLDAVKLTSEADAAADQSLIENFEATDVEYDFSSAQTKYLPRFSTEPEKNDMGKLEANMHIDVNAGICERRY
jgi:hypothetical protein